MSCLCLCHVCDVVALFAELSVVFYENVLPMVSLFLDCCHNFD